MQIRSEQFSTDKWSGLKVSLGENLPVQQPSDMAEIVVNTSPMGQYAEPVVAKLASGGWVVVWQTGSTDIDLAAQIYDANGVKVGGEFVVNTQMTGYQVDVKVAALPSGGFIATWIDQGDNYAIRTQRFDATGTKVGGEITVNTGVTGTAGDSNISVAPDGTYLVSWASGTNVGGTPTTAHYIVRYDAAGNKIGNSLTFASLNNTDADWVALSDGHFAVAYGSGYDMRAAFLDIGTGTVALGQSFLLNNPSAQPGTSANVSLVRLADGNLAAAWLAFTSGSGFQGDYGVSSRVFGKNGVIGNEASVTNTMVMLNDFRLGALADGSYAVSWTERVNSDIYASMARVFDGTGDAIGGAFQVNQTSVNSAAAASIVGLDAGHMVAVHPGRNVFMQILDVPARLSGTPNADTIAGTPRPDEIRGLDGNDIIDGGDGADEIHGGNGNDNLTGGAGHDIVAGDAGADQLSGGDGNDRLYAAQAAPETSFHYNIEGGLDRGAEIDSLSGGAGNDMLFAGLGDSVDGGDDTDTLYLSVAAATSGVSVNFSTPGAAITIAGASITNVEHLGWFDGSAFNDIVIGGPQSEVPGLYWEASGTLHGNGGNDQLTAGYYNPYVFGDAGNDTLIGSDNSDRLIGGSGADTLNGGNGNDFLSSGDADGMPFWFNTVFGGEFFDRGTEIDTLSGGAGDDMINVGYGDSADGGTHNGGDTLVLSLAGATSGVTVNFNAATMVIGGGTITGFEGIDWVEGSDFADSITFTSTYSGSQNISARGGNDTIVTATNTRYIDGGDGDDNIDARNATGLMYVTGGAGNDIIRMSSAYAQAFGGDGNDTIYGYQGVNGEAGNDIIYLAAGSNGSLFSTGGAGDDEIYAASTGNRIAGGAGADRLIGGDGNDTLYSSDLIAGTTNLSPDIGAEHDVIEAGGGNDAVAIGYGDDADGGTGNDSLILNLTGSSGVTLETGNLLGANPFTIGGGIIRNFEILSSVTGTAFDDVITASAQTTSLTINGGDGNDRLIATTSATTLSGGNGNDWLVSGTAIDTMVGGAGIDTVDFSALGAGVTVTLGANATVIVTASNGDRLSGIEDLVGTNFADELNGNDLSNYLRGGAGDDTLRGFGNDDWLYGAAGNDTMIGGVGNDRYYVDDLGDIVTELAGEGTDAVYTTLASYTLGSEFEDLFNAALGNDAFYGVGNALNNMMTGANGVDTLLGGDGNDTLDGRGGADLMYGGAGDDDYYMDDAGDLTFEDANGGQDEVFSSISQYLYANIERLTLYGTGDVYGVGNELSNDIFGNSGANLLIGGGGGDTISGADGNDTIYGQDGSDYLKGDGGVDYIVGGADADRLMGGDAADALYGEDGDDILVGGDDFATDILVGGAGNDTLYGNSGLADYDRMDGGSGNDIYYVDTGDDLTFEAVDGGIDTVYADVAGANNGVYLYANVENLVLLNVTKFGVGNELANTMTGSASGNWLLGGAGNDILNGKGGNDVLFGEGGADRFVFEQGTGGDVIGDFAVGTDKIDLSAFSGLTWQTILNSMHENGGTTAIDLQNGDFIVLNGVAAASLSQSDFILSTTPTAGVEGVELLGRTADIWSTQSDAAHTGFLDRGWSVISGGPAVVLLTEVQSDGFHLL